MAQDNTPSDQNGDTCAGQPNHLIMSQEWLHRYDDEVAALVVKSDADPDTVCDAVFLGSSSIRMWPDLEETMRPLNVKKRGYGGATMRDLMLNYPEVMAHYQPRSIVLYCDNDICGWEEGDLTVDQTYSLYKAFVERLNEDYPEADVFFLSIKHSLSRKDLRPQQEQLNSLMKRYSESNPSLTFVDVSSALLDDNGEIDDSLFMDDHLHLNMEGYKRWNQILRPLLLNRAE